MAGETMLMTKEHVARVAKNVEVSIKDVKSVADVSARSGKAPDGDCVDDAHSGEEYVEVIAHPASPGAFVIKYVRRIGQAPMQIIVNEQRKYIKVMLTCTEPLAGYQVFDEVPSFGKMQDKSLAFDFAALHNELAELSRLNE